MPSNAATTRRKSISPGISVIIQKSKGETDDAMKTQSYRFSKRRFTPEQAQAWLKSHKIKYMSFEPASDTAKENRADVMNRISKELAKEII